MNPDCVNETINDSLLGEVVGKPVDILVPSVFPASAVNPVRVESKPVDSKLKKREYHVYSKVVNMSV